MTKRESFQVEPYSIAALTRLLSFDKKTLAAAVEKKSHLTLLKEYFEKLSAATILVETDYIDRHYLEDYAGYYSRCFANYNRKCIRLHFFTIKFNDDDFFNLTVGKTSPLTHETLQSDGTYLGFIVVRPLPVAVIGRTCLTQYPIDTTHRHFPIVRDNKVHLFGIDLSVKSLAFQEQDHAVGACATTALWTLFQGTGIIFHHSIPSPYAITKMAGSIMSDSGLRLMPNNGLTPRQIGAAIRGVGLEAHSIQTKENWLVAANTYAYLRAGIPILLGAYLLDTSHGYVDKSKHHPKHAVTITGYRLDGPLRTTIFGTQEIPLTSSRMTRIYAHDDQIGPFARMEFLDSHPITFVSGATKSVDRLDVTTTSWPDDKDLLGSVFASPDLLVVPLYHKIRLTFESILSSPLTLHQLLLLALKSKHLTVPGSLEWDIFLASVSDLKSEIYNDPVLAPDTKAAVIHSSLPHYIWRARLLNDGKPLLELLFDATDVDTRSSFIQSVIYNQAFHAAFRPICQTLLTLVNTNQFLTALEPILKNLA